MGLVNINIPDSIQFQVNEIIQQDGISINQFIASAIAEKISVIKTVGYLNERAKQSSQEDFEKVLLKIPDVEPEEYDRL